MKYTEPENYLNRECTWIKFNERVLREAIVPSNPLLEQLNFVAIAASNLDEFFMIRVAGVKHLIESGVKHIDIAGMTPQEQFEAIQSMVHTLVDQQYEYYSVIQDKLQQEGLHFVSVDELNEEMIAEHLHEKHPIAWKSTEEWDGEWSNDREWS